MKRGTAGLLGGTGRKIGIFVILAVAALAAIGAITLSQFGSDSMSDTKKMAALKVLSVKLGVDKIPLSHMHGSSATVGSGSCKLDGLMVRTFDRSEFQKPDAYMWFYFTKSAEPREITRAVYLKAMKACDDPAPKLK